MQHADIDEMIQVVMHLVTGIESGGGTERADKEAELNQSGQGPPTKEIKATTLA